MTDPKELNENKYCNLRNNQKQEYYERNIFKNNYCS
jgi:hypothetical protein